MPNLKPHGPRGVMLLGFAAVSLTMGLAYAQASTSGSLKWLSDVVPINILGWLWIIVGIWLVLAAFRIRQSWALGGFSGLCFFWGSAYAISCLINLANGQPASGYTLVVVFYGLATACGAAVRMVNPAPQHLEVVVKPGHLPPEGGEGHG